MSKPIVIEVTAPLNDAVMEMNRLGLRMQVAVDGTGRFAGLLTLENVAEMMMIHSMRPDWKFAHQGR